MATGQFAGVYRQLGRLFGSGTVAGLSEGQLLDRFVSQRDDDAFEAIVARHGPMVLGVCRANLRDPNDVDDAFQATFLVLVKKATVLRNRDLLGNWLYGVANRVSRRARIEAARRRDRLAAGPEPSVVAEEVCDLHRLIHAEVDCLPARYRAPIVLCYLQGRTHEQAAQELGWPVGTVRGRLSRARDLLRDRLTRRGVGLSVVVLLTMISHRAEAGLPPILLEATFHAARSFLTAVGFVSPRVIALAQGVIHTMSPAKLKLSMTLLVAVGFTAPAVFAVQNPELKLDGVIAQKAARVNPPNADVKKTDTNVAQKAQPPVDKATVESTAQEALMMLERMVKQGEATPADSRFLEWNRRLLQAKAQNHTVTPDATKHFIEVARTREQNVLRMFEQAQASRLDYLSARLDRLEAETLAAEIGKKGGSTTSGTPGKPADEGGETVDNPPLRRLPKSDPADSERNKVIEKALEKKLTLNFEEGTSLADILKYIRVNTTDEKADLPSGIPIYVDPYVVLDPSTKPPTRRERITKVPIDFEGIPLRITLRLVVDQFGLAYKVRDQLVYIMDENLIDMRFSEPFSEPRQMMGGRGMGGMGMGGMGMPGRSGVPPGSVGQPAGTTLPNTTQKK